MLLFRVNAPTRPTGPSEQRRRDGSGSGFLTRLSDHDVVVVAISDPQDVGGYAVAAAGVQEPLHGLQELHTGFSS